MAKRIATTLPIILIIFFLLTVSYSENLIIGKVVGISDGDTITVLQSKAQHKIRLYGIDCPESGQDFGTRAKRFTSDLVFNQDVRVVSKDTDRYGRVVGIVYVGNTCVNAEIVRAGFAWVYDQYCKEAVCQSWKAFEVQARGNRIGLWSHSNPVPPWDFRKGGQQQAPSYKQEKGFQNKTTGYHGNTSSMIFHQPACKYYNCKNCTAVFKTREEAIRAGYRPCKNCKP